MTILVTGCAGFIGFHVTAALLSKGQKVVGIDNLCPYYDVSLKEARLSQLQGDFTLYRLDLQDQAGVQRVIDQHQDITSVIHLAAQAGVRYSLENPYSYVSNNIMAFVVLLEAVRSLPIRKFLYASSSSVYGANTKKPFSVNDAVDQPLSLYAATKRADELIAHAYHGLYQMPLVGLRFFTVYGPFGRPDMSAFIFTKALYEGRPLPIFNQGKMRRNFTYIDDIVKGVLECLSVPFTSPALYNLGNNRSEALLDFVHLLEEYTGRQAVMDLQPLQKGDVPETIADLEESERDFGFKPTTDIREGLKKFVDWYKEFYA